MITHLSLAKFMAGDSAFWHYLASETRDLPMALHLVGESLDAKRAHQRAQLGKLERLIRTYESR